MFVFGVGRPSRARSFGTNALSLVGRGFRRRGDTTVALETGIRAIVVAREQPLYELLGLISMVGPRAAVEVVAKPELQRLVEPVASEIPARGREEVPDIERPIHWVTQLHLEDLIGEYVLVVGVEAFEKQGVHVVSRELLVVVEVYDNVQEVSVIPRDITFVTNETRCRKLNELDEILTRAKARGICGDVRVDFLDLIPDVAPKRVAVTWLILQGTPYVS